MTSFISALSLFVLALVSGCFTLPITENPLSDTSSPFYNDVTTDKPLGERMVSEDATISSTFIGIQRSSDKSRGFETSSTFEDATREPRTFVDVATKMSATFVPTSEKSFHQQREMKDSSDVTVEPTTERVEFTPRGFGEDSENETEVTTESSPSKREFNDSDLTTSNSVGGFRSSERLFATIEPKTSSTEMQLDFTTNVMPSFTSTSSAVAPQLYTREPSTTRKYTGFLADKEDQEEEKEHNDEEHEKAHGKHKKPHEQHESESEEHKHDDEVKKDKKHKKLQSKHGKDELEVEEPKQEGDKEVEEKKKVSGKHEKEDTEEEEPKQEGDKKQKKVSRKHGKEENVEEEPKQEEVQEEKKVSEKHGKDEIEEEEPKQKGDKKQKKVSRKHGKEEIEEEEEPKQEGDKKEKKVSRKHGKEETVEEEPKQEGDEEGRQFEKHDEVNFDKDVEAAQPKDLTKKRPTTFRKPKVESDDDIQYPKAFYDQDAWKKVPRIPSDFAVLDETSDVVTALNKLDSLYTVESYTEESKLNQGKESSRAE